MPDTFILSHTHFMDAMGVWDTLMIGTELGTSLCPL